MANISEKKGEDGAFPDTCRVRMTRGRGEGEHEGKRAKGVG